MSGFSNRREALLALGAWSMAFASGPSWSQDFPSKPLRMVVAYPPGGPVDVVARIIEEPLSKALGQPIIIEYKPGAGGVIGSDFVAKSRADGYTLLMGSTPLAIQETLVAKLPYSALTDFTTISNVAEGPQVLVIPTKLPVNSVRELIDYAKAKGSLNFASPSAGGSNHLAAEMFKGAAGINATHIPYKGSAPAEVDLIGGQVDFMFGALTTSLRHVESGRLRALGVTTKTRFANAPNIPTIAETLPGFEVSSWYGLLGPKGIPPQITNRINAEVNKIILSADVRARLNKVDLEPSPGSADHFGQYLRQNTEAWRKVIKDNNVKTD
jgi:tripartite-type tricarboxylate transporter receptor subunit TctC